MSTAFLGLLAVAVVALPGCGDDDPASPSAPSTEPDSTSTTAGGSTSVAAAADPSITLVPVARMAGTSGIADPDGDGPVLIATLAGEIRALDLATGAAELALDLSDQVSTGGERGVLDVAVTPDGERLVVNLTDPSGDTEIRSWPLDAGLPVGDAASGVLHLEIEQPFANHNGGNLEFGPDGYLWIGTGDGGSGGDPDDRAQNPDDLLGKMLRVSLDPGGGVTAPDDNPSGGAPEVWGLGLRNPWRYSFDPATGDLWIADVGQNEIEEVTVVDPDAFDRSTAPANFGWNRLEGNEPFEGDAPPDAIASALTYRHDETGGCSITGGHVYRGSAVPSLAGWYVFGDYCGGWLWAVPSDDPGSAPVELASGIGPVVSIEVLDDGELVVLTADAVLRLAA